MADVAALVPAAGRGTRMGPAGDKLYLDLAGLPVLARTLRALQAAHDLGVGEIVVAVAPGAAARFEREVRPHLHAVPPVHVVQGGETRQASVLAALDRVRDAALVLVHDGARPLVPKAVLERCIGAARRGRCVVAALPVKDTIKAVDPSGRVLSTPDRRGLWAVQTPQVFPLAVLRAAHQRALQEGVDATDDAALVERTGEPVYVVEGDEVNLKITTPHDLIVAAAYLRAGEGA